LIEQRNKIIYGYGHGTPHFHWWPAWPHQNCRSFQ
jgi:hypothetical protein